MAKKIVKKRKLKLLNFLIVLLVLAGLFFSGVLLSKIPVKNIVIKNTKYLNDDYILNLGDIVDYPSFFLTKSRQVEKKIKASKYIKNVELKKEWGFKFVLEVEEYKALFYNNLTEKYVFDKENSVSKEEISDNFRVPRLINYVPDTKYNKLILKMGKIDEEILSKISDIEYQPNEYDKDRFLLYMDDSNMVFLTLTKFEMINHYNEVLSQLENHKGILYLDNGNHFQIKE